MTTRWTSVRTFVLVACAQAIAMQSIALCPLQAGWPLHHKSHGHSAAGHHACPEDYRGWEPREARNQFPCLMYCYGWEKPCDQGRKDYPRYVYACPQKISPEVLAGTGVNFERIDGQRVKWYAFNETSTPVTLYLTAEHYSQGKLVDRQPWPEPILIPPATPQLPIAETTWEAGYLEGTSIRVNR